MPWAFLFFAESFGMNMSVGVGCSAIATNARRLCEVFCISQNLQMYEVPERASDGKASGRCSGSPKGFRYIVSGLCVRAGLEVQSFNLFLKFIISRKLQFCTSPRLTQNPC